jgi:hypothetical protein
VNGMNAEHSQKISWYALERVAQGHLSAAETNRLLTICTHNPQLNRRLVAIQNDNRSMPPFAPVGHVRKSRHFPLFNWPVPAMALVVTILISGIAYLAVQKWFEPSVPATNHTGMFHDGVKGGDMALKVIRSRGDITSHRPGTFNETDRFRFYVTTPIDTATSHPVEVTVFQGEDVFFPYARRLALPQGNLRALPGSLRFSGRQPVQICISVGSDIPSRNHIRQMKKKALPKTTVCTALSHE